MSIYDGNVWFAYCMHSRCILNIIFGPRLHPRFWLWPTLILSLTPLAYAYLHLNCLCICWLGTCWKWHHGRSQHLNGSQKHHSKGLRPLYVIESMPSAFMRTVNVTLKVYLKFRLNFKALKIFRFSFEVKVKIKMRKYWDHFSKYVSNYCDILCF